MASRSAIARYRVFEEPNGSFALDATGSLGSFLDLRSMESPFGAPRVSLPDQRVRAYRVDQPKDQFGFRSATWDWSGHLVSHGTALNAAASAPSIDGLGTVLKAMFGGRAIAAGSTVAASPSPTSTGLSVATGHGSRMPAGRIVWVADSSGRYHPAKVKTQSSDALTFACALSFTPAAGAVVLNSETFYETDKPNTSLQFVAEGENRNGNVFVLMGCHGSLQFNLQLGQLAMVSAQWQVARWLRSAESAGTPASGSLSHSLPAVAPVPISASSIVFCPSGATTRAAPSIESFALNVNHTYQAIASMNGVDGVAERVRVASEITATITLPVSDSSPDEYITARDAGTTYQLLLNLNDQTGGALLAVEMGTVQIRAEPKMVMKNGIRYQEIPVLALADDNATDKTTDERRSPVRIARG